jgi:hypothetical protein
MPDCVLDASVVALSNGDLAGRRSGNMLDRRLLVLEEVIADHRRLRYNARLLGEYQRLIQDYRNDVIELLFRVLDSDRSVRVSRNNLTSQNHAMATRRCRWPSHDQHLLAAALDGVDPSIFVTEDRLARCAAQILTHFDVHITRLA